MTDYRTYPPIEPSTYDLLIVGTGLPESVLAAAASAAGKSVLHLDPNSFYGSHFSTLTLDEFSLFLNSQSSTANTFSHLESPSCTVTDGDDYIVAVLQTRPMYSNLEINSYSSELLEHARKFNLDVAGPRVLFCADSSVDLMLKSGASQYVEFKSVDANFVCDSNGMLSRVPDSRAAIFKDRTLSLTEKNQLMRFFKLVQQHLASGGDGDDNGGSSRISDEDLESPFVDFLKKMRLPQKIKSVILYGIAMADYDQDNTEVCKVILKTKNGIDRLALYNQSVGRFPNALGALIYPIYGQGELAQAFCRRAAVKGCLYVLRMPAIALLIDKSSGCYRGVRLSSGQDIFSHQLVLDPSFVVPLSLKSPSPNLLQNSPQHFNLGDVKGKVARGICITRSSLQPDVSSFLLIYPPGSLFPEQVTSIRVLQIGSNLAVCPTGMFLLYLSALCDDADQGKKLLREAVNSLFSPQNFGEPDISPSVQSESTEEMRPSLLWSALYIQELSMGSFEAIVSTPMPDGNLNDNDILNATAKLFQNMYPNEDFFPEAASSERMDLID